MDIYQRLKKNKSVFFACESSRKKIFLSFITCLLLSGCQISGPKQAPNLKKQEDVPPVNLEQQIESSKNSELGVPLTLLGNNSEPFLSNDGKKLFFASSARRSHSSKQIYMLDFESMKERRLTFNDGDNSTPILVEGFNLLAYSSNTDFLKEHPAVFYPNKSPFESDIYISEISGSAIERLTVQDGYEGELQSFGQKKGTFLFLSQTANRKSIHRMNVTNRATTLLFSLPTESRSIKQSPDQKAWLWLERKDGKEFLQLSPNPSQIKTVLTLEMPFESITDINWISSKQVILAGRPNAKIIDPKEKEPKYIAALVDLEKLCLQRILKGDGVITSPLFDPQKQSIIYSSDASGSSQIYLKQVSLSEIPCQAYQ